MGPIVLVRDSESAVSLRVLEPGVDETSIRLSLTALIEALAIVWSLSGDLLVG